MLFVVCKRPVLTRVVRILWLGAGDGRGRGVWSVPGRVGLMRKSRFVYCASHVCILGSECGWVVCHTNRRSIPVGAVLSATCVVEEMFHFVVMPNANSQHHFVADDGGPVSTWVVPRCSGLCICSEPVDAMLASFRVVPT